MGHVEKFINRFEPDDHFIKERCREVKRDIQIEWDRYCRCEMMMHGRDVQGDEFDALLYYLVKRKIL